MLAFEEKAINSKAHADTDYIASIGTTCNLNYGKQEPFVVTSSSGGCMSKVHAKAWPVGEPDDHLNAWPSAFNICE